MQSCHDVCRQSQAYVDGQLGFWARLRVRSHVWMCRNCAAFVEQTRATRDLIAGTRSDDDGPAEKVSPVLLKALRDKQKD